MFNWFKKREKEVIESNEYKKLSSRLDEMESVLFKISNDYLYIKKKFNGKLYKEILADSFDTTDTKDLSNSVLLPEDGTIKRNRKLS